MLRRSLPILLRPIQPLSKCHDRGIATIACYLGAVTLDIAHAALEASGFFLGQGHIRVASLSCYFRRLSLFPGCYGWLFSLLLFRRDCRKGSISAGTLDCWL
jgi:hypothetical protein